MRNRHKRVLYIGIAGHHDFENAAAAAHIAREYAYAHTSMSKLDHEIEQLDETGTAGFVAIVRDNADADRIRGLGCGFVIHLTRSGFSAVTYMHGVDAAVVIDADHDVVKLRLEDAVDAKIHVMQCKAARGALA